MQNNSPPILFDPRRKQAVMNRAAGMPHDGSNAASDKFLWQYMADDIAERLAAVSREFASTLFIGPIGQYAAQILAGRQTVVTIAGLCHEERRNCADMQIDEEHLPFEPGSFDLIVSAGTLDSLNDLPGNLIQMRRILIPDGLLLATMFGAENLPKLRSAMLKADGARVSAHIHPQIELRSAADLLSRTGYALPVADIDNLNVRYSSVQRLVHDLRRSGLTNKLAGVRAFCGKNYLGKLEDAWREHADADGKVAEQFAFISLSGWAPSPDQPKPARRGSGKMSLADALKPQI
jgi:NADH dehydrogenase [ubiquinone] 1 alpha subcomplex assembly factor 5